MHKKIAQQEFKRETERESEKLGIKAGKTLSSVSLTSTLKSQLSTNNNQLKRQESTRKGYSASEDTRRNHEIAVGGHTHDIIKSVTTRVGDPHTGE